jgi:hypothetical protein
VGAPGSPERTSRARSYTQTVKWRAVGFVSVVLVLAVGWAVYRADRHRAVVHGWDPRYVAPVLVAKQLIPKGTPGARIASQSMYQATTLPPKELKDGAISDLAYLRGRATAVDIYPGQQFTTTQFAP